MISRFGQPLYLGWPEHHLEWIRAALTLDYRDRQAAFKDIADMTGRGLKAVRERAKRIRDQDRRQSEIALRRVMRLPPHWGLPPSELRRPTLARLMAGRA